MISAIICTRDRPDLLQGAVASLAAQTLPAADYEVVVVDNGSGQAGSAIRDGCAGGRLDLRLVREPAVGLSAARNRGIAEARGALLAFLDDDARARPGWLAALVGAFAEHPGAVAVGGPVVLTLPGPRPPWLTAHLARHLGQVELGGQAREMVYPEIPFGTNMAFRRRSLEGGPGFSPCLGRQGRGLLSGEEEELILRLAARGGEIWYEPRAVVDHLVPSERLTPSWTLRRCFDQGRSAARMELLADGGRRLALRRAAAVATHGLLRGKRALLTRMLRDPVVPSVADEIARMTQCSGFVVERLRTRSSPPGPGTSHQGVIPPPRA